MRQVRALLLAAGLGTRLHPLTEQWPKCLMPIGNRPLLEYWLETLWRSGIREVLVNLHYLPTVVEEFLADPVFKAGFILLGKKNCLGPQALFEQMPTISEVIRCCWCMPTTGANANLVNFWSFIIRIVQNPRR